MWLYAQAVVCTHAFTEWTTGMMHKGARHDSVKFPRNLSASEASADASSDEIDPRSARGRYRGVSEVIVSCMFDKASRSLGKSWSAGS